MEISRLRHLKSIIFDQSSAPQTSQVTLWLRSRLHQYLRLTNIPMNYGTSGKSVSASYKSALLLIPALAIPASVTALFIGGAAVTATPQAPKVSSDMPGSSVGSFGVGHKPLPAPLDELLLVEASPFNPSPLISEITINNPGMGQTTKGLSGGSAAMAERRTSVIPSSPATNFINFAVEWTPPGASHQKQAPSQKSAPVVSGIFQTRDLQEISPVTLPSLPQQFSPNSGLNAPTDRVTPEPLPKLAVTGSVTSNMTGRNVTNSNTNTANAGNNAGNSGVINGDRPNSAANSTNPPANTPTNNSPTATPNISPTTLAQSKPTPASTPSNTTSNTTNNSTGNSPGNSTDGITITPASPSGSSNSGSSAGNAPNNSSNTNKGTNSVSATNAPTSGSNSSGVVNANIPPQTSVLVTPSAQNNRLEPVQTLVVPTTPSQVRLERVQKITLKEAIELVGRTQRDIIQARIAVEKARGVVQEAEAAKNPTVSGNVTYNFNDSAQTRLSNIANNLRSSTISQPLQGTVGVQYTLFDSGVNDTNVRIAVQTLRTAEADLNRVSQVAYLNVATAYYGLQNADGTVTIYEKQVENNERSLKDTQARERAGVGTKFDVLQSEVQLANARQDLLNAKVNQANARRELARLLSYVPTLDITAADEIQPVEPWNKPIEETILLAMRNRSELDVRRLEREIARERANLSISRTGPQVSVFANYNLADDFNTAGGFAMGYQLGARVDFTLFDGGRAQAQVRQFKADQALAESRFEQDARQARFDVESSYNTMIGRRQQIETAEKGLKQAEDALRLSRLRLSAGVGTQLEVISAENDLTRARVNRLQAITGYNQARANLERAINGMPNY